MNVYSDFWGEKKIVIVVFHEFENRIEMSIVFYYPPYTYESIEIYILFSKYFMVFCLKVFDIVEQTVMMNLMGKLEKL